MASTNKTTNYELSQYVGTDKPTYLGDYNSDMLKIDTAIHGVSENVGTETARINIIENNIGTLGNLTTDEKGSLVGAINEVDSNADTNATNIGTLSNLETTNKTNVVNAINELKETINNFNLTNFHNVSASEVTVTDGTLNNCTLSYATNSDGSLAKIYGYCNVSSNGISSPRISFTTSLRPEEEISINGLVFNTEGKTNGITTYSDLKIKTTGVVEFRIWNSFNFNNGAFNTNIVPCLLYIKDFGDIAPQQ